MRPTERNLGAALRSWLPLVAVAAVAVLLVFFVKFPRQPTHPSNWQAFVDPAVAGISVHPVGGLCGKSVSVKESGDQIRVKVTQDNTAFGPGRGSCVAPESSRVVRLHHPLEARPVRSGLTGSNGDTFDLSTRLHPRFRTAADLPDISVAQQTAAGWQWTLGFTRPDRRGYYWIVSVPAPASTGKRGPATCHGVACWQRDGIAYSLIDIPSTPDGLAPAEVHTLIASFVAG